MTNKSPSLLVDYSSQRANILSNSSMPSLGLVTIMGGARPQCHDHHHQSWPLATGTTCGGIRRSQTCRNQNRNEPLLLDGKRDGAQVFLARQWSESGVEERYLYRAYANSGTTGRDDDDDDDLRPCSSGTDNKVEFQLRNHTSRRRSHSSHRNINNSTLSDIIQNTSQRQQQNQDMDISCSTARGMSVSASSRNDLRQRQRQARYQQQRRRTGLTLFQDDSQDHHRRRCHPREIVIHRRASFSSGSSFKSTGQECIQECQSYATVSSCPDGGGGSGTHFFAAGPAASPEPTKTRTRPAAAATTCTNHPKKLSSSSLHVQESFSPHSGRHHSNSILQSSSAGPRRSSSLRKLQQPARPKHPGSMFSSPSIHNHKTITTTKRRPSLGSRTLEMLRNTPTLTSLLSTKRES